MLEGYVVTTKQNKTKVGVIHCEIEQTYWAKGMPLPTLKQTMANSPCFAALNQ